MWTNFNEIYSIFLHFLDNSTKKEEYCPISAPKNRFFAYQPSFLRHFHRHSADLIWFTYCNFPFWYFSYTFFIYSNKKILSKIPHCNFSFLVYNETKKKTKKDRTVDIMYQINLNKPCTVYFIGIGGISMSGFAQLFHENGFTVKGSDSQESKKIGRASCRERV